MVWSPQLWFQVQKHHFAGRIVVVVVIGNDVGNNLGVEDMERALNEGRGSVKILMLQHENHNTKFRKMKLKKSGGGDS